MYGKFSQLLQAKGVTVAQMCRETGINESTMSNWKKRDGKPSVDTLAKIANYFGVTLDYFMDDGKTRNEIK